MKFFFSLFLILFFVFGQYGDLYGDNWDSKNLLEDLLIVDYFNRHECDKMPVHYNHLYQGGYINMPSARVGDEGEIGGGYAWVPPYHIYSARTQLNKWIEVTANYRVFKGINDPVLSEFGFGDFSDKGANVKFTIIRPEDSDYAVPGFAVGFDDFLGTRSFKSFYAVLTQVFPDQNMELSLGWGEWRIHGFFAGLSWMPFRNLGYGCLENLVLEAEWDAIPYKSEEIEPHPDGRVQKTHINLGAKYRLWDTVDLSASWIRGDAFAFSLSGYYNFGKTKGFLPKFTDPLPYTTPVITEPIGHLRPDYIMAHEFNYAFCRQGFDILEVQVYYNECNQKILWLHAINNTYRTEPDVKHRLSYLLGNLTPADIDIATVVIDVDGVAIQEYRFSKESLDRFRDQSIGEFELDVLSPLCNVAYRKKYEPFTLFKKRRDLFCFSLLPDYHTFFGSAQGKFKYDLGAAIEVDGYFPKDIYYSVKLTKKFVSDLEDLKDVDRLNPSQLINVRTDIVNYYKQTDFNFDEIYLQKSWNLGKGWFARAGLGHFEIQYGGFAGEVLWYPVNCSLAFGIEGAILKKRNTKGLGFTNKIRKLKGFIPTYEHFTGTQCFFNAYYDWQQASLELRLKAGQFLAKDVGIRYEISRYFESGLRITFWYTRTNGHDKVNGETYYDKGASISLPLDIFYTCSSTKRFGWGMSAWLRDVGQFAYTGRTLYETINDQRQY